MVARVRNPIPGVPLVGCTDRQTDEHVAHSDLCKKGYKHRARSLGSEKAFRGRHVCIAQAPRQRANAPFWHPEIQEVNRDGPSLPIILAETIKCECDVPFQTRSRALDRKELLPS